MDVPDPEPEPSSTFKLHIGENNVVAMDMSAPDYYPDMYSRFFLVPLL